MSQRQTKLFIAFFVFAVLLYVLFLISSESFSTQSIGALIIVTSLIMVLQGLTTLCWMLYAWEDPSSMAAHKSPRQFQAPAYSFTALIPARHEHKIIGDTIKAIERIDYPAELKEIIVLCRIDDMETINEAQKMINQLDSHQIKLVTFGDYPINKPHALNIGLRQANNQIVAIFDAEDEPHQDIYKIINTILIEESVSVVQSGVQLINLNSTWFSALNCLEYFFWFKSGLHFFSNIAALTPLGGNTVFFKKESLIRVVGWDETCLTEDADIGFRLASLGFPARVVYDEEHATLEETPDSLTSFIKQRTRWNQGFLQMVVNGSWRRLPRLSQKLVALYILLSPQLQALFLIVSPFVIWLALTLKVQILISLFSFLPLIIFILQIMSLEVGLYELTRAYKLRLSWLLPIKLLIFFYPYQVLLLISSFRSIIRMMLGNSNWEKTFHPNAHREKIVWNYVK